MYEDVHMLIMYKVNLYNIHLLSLRYILYTFLLAMRTFIPPPSPPTPQKIRQQHHVFQEAKPREIVAVEGDNKLAIVRSVSFLNNKQIRVIGL